MKKAEIINNTTFEIFHETTPIREKGVILWEDQKNLMAKCYQKVQSVGFYQQIDAEINEHIYVQIKPEQINELAKIIDKIEREYSIEFWD